MYDTYLLKAGRALSLLLYLSLNVLLICLRFSYEITSDLNCLPGHISFNYMLRIYKWNL